MKKYLFLLMLMTGTSLICQESMESKVLEVVNEYSIFDPSEKLDTRIRRLKNLDEDWLKNFWLSVIYSNRTMSNSLDSAKKHLGKSIDQIGSETPRITSSIFALKSHILQKEAVLEKPNKKSSEMADQASELLNMSILADPENPTAKILTAIATINSSRKASDLAASNALLQEAKRSIEVISNPETQLIWNSSYLSIYDNALQLLLNPLKLKNLSEFEIRKASPKIIGLDWELLIEDKMGDGRLTNSGDGKSLHYCLLGKDLWFKLVQYNDISTTFPAVSISLDTDGDPTNGVAWYGSNKGFMVDKLVSVGIAAHKLKGKVHGYNGITDAVGIQKRDWLNRQKGIVDFYVDDQKKSYYLRIDIDELEIEGDQIRVIGSVGSNTIWNDDIGDNEAAFIKIK